MYIIFVNFLIFVQVPSVLFAPCHLMAIFTLGIQTGLVVDCGYNETVVLPISFTVCIFVHVDINLTLEPGIAEFLVLIEESKQMQSRHEWHCMKIKFSQRLNLT